MIKAIVTDIEGTTCPLTFVRDVLFPYARQHIEEFVREHAMWDEIENLVDEVRKEVGKELSFDEVIHQLIEWIDQDKKITPLKEIQGLLWEAGFKNGEFKTPVYPDARTGLEQWHQQGVKLYVYSSGSVHAQKLLFGYTDHGDLNDLFDGYFDTRTGDKTESRSYQTIASELKCEPQAILFLSDSEAELDAARTAGMKTIQIVREGDATQPGKHPYVASFEQIDPAQL